MTDDHWFLGGPAPTRLQWRWAQLRLWWRDKIKKLNKVVGQLDARHHRKPFPGSWLFCDLWDWRVGVDARTLLRERWCAITGRDPYPNRREI